MGKFDYIFKEEDNNVIPLLTNDLEQVLNKYGLTLITFVDGQDEFEGNIVAFFDVQDSPDDKPYM